MRKLSHHLIAWVLTIVIILLLAGCKVKKEDIKVKDSTSAHSVEHVELKNKSLIDTSHRVKSKTIDQKSVIISSDAGKTKVTITPTSGTTSVVDPDGTFHGQAESITTEHASIKHTNKTTLTKKHSRQDDQHQKTQTEISQSHTKQKDSVSSHQLDKHLDIKPSVEVWPLAGVITAAIILGILIFFLRKIF